MIGTGREAAHGFLGDRAVDDNGRTLRCYMNRIKPEALRP
jgi:hypothetical protein